MDKSILDQLREGIETAKDMGWSENQIAQESGVPQPSLNRWLSGNRKSLTEESLSRLAAWLGMRFTKPKVPKRKNPDQKERQAT